jgi:hypothetical protein
MQQNYADINHQFDIWHIAKNISKKLRQKALKKEVVEQMPWIHSVTNHLWWWSLQTSGANPGLLKEKWISCVNYVVKIHKWNGLKFSQGEHGDVNSDVDWLQLDSEAHKALKKAVLDKRLERLW